jgi:hypothetical protein
MLTPSSGEPAPTPAYIAAYNRLKEENLRLKSYIQWEDHLFANPHLSASHKLTLRSTRRAIYRGQTHDEQGRTRINFTTIAEQIGSSSDTVSRSIKHLVSLNLLECDLKTEIQENGERWTRVYARLNEEVIKTPEKIIPAQPRNHGGPRYACPQCGNTNIIIRRRVTLVCSCGHESLISETESRQEQDFYATTGQQDAHEQVNAVAIDETVHATDQQDASATADKPCETCAGANEPTSNLRHDLKPVSPLISGISYNSVSNTDHPVAGETESKLQDGQTLREVAALLLSLAGQSDEHIEMSRTADKKYYTVSRPLTERDLLDHLCGGKARGALCHYPDGRTRGLGWDEDTAAGWAVLQDAARTLVSVGYLPILEPSPAGRGGHLWIVFDALVDASTARQHIYSLAPALATIKEYWPGPQEAKRWNKVRLPGGKYVRPGINAWCPLISVSDGETSHDGLSAAQILLAHQTPASIVAVSSSCKEETPVEVVMLSGKVQDESNLHEQATNIPANANPTSKLLPGDRRHKQSIDSQWRATYGQNESGSHLWFAFTPQYLASWYNAHHDIRDLLPPERNGYGLASWRGEQTASVAMRDNHWTDFGASARRPDGMQDGGDALELQVRLTQTSKSDILRQVAKELVAQARAELESTAQAGQPIPSWIEAILTDAGRAYFEQIKCEKHNAFDKPSSHLSVSSQSQKDTFQALAKDIDAEIGEPCKHCGCILFYHNAHSDKMCHWCFPRPAKYAPGKLTDEQWDRLRQLVKSSKVRRYSLSESHDQSTSI